MAAPAHNRKALAEFQDGDSRLVFARYKERPSELFYLKDNHADAQRAFTKEHLACFMPECDSRALTTVSRGKY